MIMPHMHFLSVDKLLKAMNLYHQVLLMLLSLSNVIITSTKVDLFGEKKAPNSKLHLNLRKSENMAMADLYRE